MISNNNIQYFSELLAIENGDKENDIPQQTASLLAIEDTPNVDPLSSPTMIPPTPTDTEEYGYDDVTVPLPPAGGDVVDVSIEELPSSGIKLPAKAKDTKPNKGAMTSSSTGVTSSMTSSSEFDSFLSSMDDDIPTLEKKKRKRKRSVGKNRMLNLL